MTERGTIYSCPVSVLELNEGQAAGLPANPRTWTRDELDSLKKSLTETPELFDARPVLAWEYADGCHIVLGGNMRLCAARELGWPEIPTYVFPHATPTEKLMEIVIKDNGAFGAWDWDMLANEWDVLPLSEWGVPTWKVDKKADDEEAEIERKRKEFEKRMATGENLDEDEEYLTFLDKFALKKTTDDCYTPAPVYDAVAEWVANEYQLSRADFVRPFYPGGAYRNETYKPTDVVVDNPPFSILAEILKFYLDNGVRFFLFAPHLTLFSSSSSSSSCAIGVGVVVTYENGAHLPTSFLTNLEDGRFRSSPSLYAAVNGGVDEYLQQKRQSPPRYAYDHHVLTSNFLAACSRLGIEFGCTKSETLLISRLDSQKETGKTIYGEGYLIGEDAFERREKAEREKAEREKAVMWEISERERAIIASLH